MEKMTATETSVQTYLKQMPKFKNDAQRVLWLFEQAPDGLVDVEVSRLMMQHFNIKMPPSTVSARAHDIAKMLGKHVIVHRRGERRRDVHTGNTGMVWRHVKYIHR